MFFYHLTKCSARSITTADILCDDVIRDRIPQDSETREHFGLTRCRDWRDESYLLGLYQCLIRVLGIRPIQLNEWREKGILVSKIMEVFFRLPESNRGAYFSWFLRNQHILDNSASPLQHSNWQTSSQVGDYWQTTAAACFTIIFFFFPLCIWVFRVVVNANLMWGLVAIWLIVNSMFIM